MRLHRLLGIIMLIDSRKIVKAATLAKILETSERSIYRDIDILCESGIPITSTPGPNGGYSFMENYKINPKTLESSDAITLLLSSMGIMPEKNTENEKQLKNALIKLENSVSEEHKQEIIKAKERFFIDSEPWWGKRIQTKNVDIIKKSVLNLNKLKVCYKKYGGETSKRILRPYGVVVKNSHWYVVAFCELKDEIKIFKFNRLEDIEILDDKFTMPKDFYLDEFWENSKKQFTKHTSLNEHSNSYPVKIKFFIDKGQILQGFNILSSTKLGEHWIYNIDMLSFETACNVIFPLSDKIEVLEPLNLRDYLLTKAKKIINLYESK